VTPVLLLAVALFVQAKPPPRAPELAVSVQYAPSGDLAGLWQTYVVELDSRTSRDLDLRIRIEDDNYLVVATRAERLSPKAKKRVFLYAPIGSFARGAPAHWRISDVAGEELGSGTMPMASRGYVANSHQVGLFCRIPAADDDFGIPNALNNVEVRCFRLSPATLPDRWIGLAAFDLILLHDAPLDELTADQSRALSDYVRQGGTLLLVPGATSGWLRHPTLAALAPVKADAPQTVTSLPGLNTAYGEFRSPEPFLSQKLKNGMPGFPSRPELGQDIVRFDAGFGRVYVVGVDLRHAPFDTWAGRRGFWGDQLSQHPRWFDESAPAFPSVSSLNLRQELFRQVARLINPYPPFGLIFALAVLFLAAVGPLNYAILWKLRRTLLLVVTVPAISLGFLALIFMLGYLLKGTSTVVHSARLLTTRSGLDCARETQMYSLFSPSSRTYDVSFAPGTFGPTGRWTAWENQPYQQRSRELMATMTCDTGSGLAIKGLGAGQWQSWNLEARGLRDLGKGVRFTLEGDKVRIVNGSPHVIERGVFLQTGTELRSAPFGRIEPGGSAEVTTSRLQTTATEAAGFPPESLGDCALKSWLDTISGTPSPASPTLTVHPFLLCVLKEGEPTVTVDARLSGRSQALTLLHVSEGP